MQKLRYCRQVDATGAKWAELDGTPQVQDGLGMEGQKVRYCRQVKSAGAKWAEMGGTPRQSYYPLALFQYL